MKPRKGPLPAILGKGSAHANKKQDYSLDHGEYNGWLDSCDICGYALFECLCTETETGDRHVSE